VQFYVLPSSVTLRKAPFFLKKNIFDVLSSHAQVSCCGSMLLEIKNDLSTTNNTIKYSYSALTNPMCLGYHDLWHDHTRVTPDTGFGESLV